MILRFLKRPFWFILFCFKTLGVLPSLAFIQNFLPNSPRNLLKTSPANFLENIFTNYSADSSRNFSENDSRIPNKNFVFPKNTIKDDIMKNRPQRGGYASGFFRNFSGDLFIFQGFLPRFFQEPFRKFCSGLFRKSPRVFCRNPYSKFLTNFYKDSSKIFNGIHWKFGKECLRNFPQFCA